MKRHCNLYGLLVGFAIGVLGGVAAYMIRNKEAHPAVEGCVEYLYCGNYPFRTCYPESWSVWQENDTLWYVQPDDPREGFWVRVDYSGLTPERFEQIAQYIAASSGSDENVKVSTGKVGRYPYGYYEFTYENVYGERWTECRYALYYNDSIAYLVNFEGRSELLDESIRARNFEIVKNFEMLPR